jgi:hypothetical protein
VILFRIFNFEKIIGGLSDGVMLKPCITVSM